MSPIAIGMDLMLALLLLAALGFGIRLDRRLKQLREGQRDFAGAVADLDRAAQRAERGLSELRAATDEAVDLLAGRIEKARELATRLETMTSDAARPIARPAPAAARAPAPVATRAPAPVQPIATSPRIVRTPARELPPVLAEAAAEDFLLRLTEEMPEGAPGRATEQASDLLFDPAPMGPLDRAPAERALPERPPVERLVRLEPRVTPRSRANVDDDLFDSGPIAAGGRS